jgi:hypothetical protein
VRFRARKSWRIGPPRFCIKFHATLQSGYTGWSVKVWRWTYSSRTGRQTLDTPGLGHLEWGGKPSAGRRRPKSGGAE